MLQAAIEEVVDLHRFFQDWLGGLGPAGEEHFQRLDRALAPDFELVSPGGATLSRAALMESLRTAYGDRGSHFRLWVERVEGRELVPGLYLVTYQEWQAIEAKERGRVSTAILSTVGSGIRWQHVHETWLPQE